MGLSEESACSAETPVRSLGQEDPLEAGLAAHSSILVWRIPWTEEPSRLHSPGCRKESDMTEVIEQACMQTEAY